MLSMPLPVPGSVSRALKLVRGSPRFPDLYHVAARRGAEGSCSSEASGIFSRIVRPELLDRHTEFGYGRALAGEQPQSPGCSPTERKQKKTRRRAWSFVIYILY